MGSMPGNLRSSNRAVSRRPSSYLRGGRGRPCEAGPGGQRNLPGIPFPGLVYERRPCSARGGDRAVLTGAAPHRSPPTTSTARSSGRTGGSGSTAARTMLQESAAPVGEAYRSRVAACGAWVLTDRAVRAYPAEIPMSTFGFPWFRLWVRPVCPRHRRHPGSGTRVL